MKIKKKKIKGKEKENKGECEQKWMTKSLGKPKKRQKGRRGEGESG